MKKIHLLLMSIALLTGLSACSDNWSPGSNDDGEGQVSLASMGVEVSEAENVESRATVDLSSFIITITDAQGAEKARWTYASMPEVFTLPVGAYTVTVKSHEVQKAQWDAPLYEGSTNFTIKNGEITSIGVIVCKLANIKVSILFTDDLRARLGDDVTVTVIANDEGQLVYTPSETRVGCFEALPGSSTLVATFNGTLTGESEPVTLRKVYTDVKGGSHYRITFSLRNSSGEMPDETGGITLSDGLTLDSEITDKDINGNTDIEEDIIPGDRPGEGEPDPGPGPVDPETTITMTSPTLSFDKANDPNDAALVESSIVNIHADNGIQHLIVHIESDSESFIASAGEMVPFDFDLANPVIDGKDWSDMLGAAGLGFPVKDQVVGKTDVVFDITQFVPLLGGFSGNHKFSITVTDGDNKQLTRTLTFIAE